MTSVATNLDAAGAGPAFSIKPGQSLSYAATGTFTGLLFFERSRNGGMSWETVATDVDDGFSGTVKNETTGDERFRFRLEDTDSETPVTGEAETAIADLDDVVLELKRPDGSVYARVTDDGITFVGAVALPTTTTVGGGQSIPGYNPNDIRSTEEVVTNGDTATEVSIDVYKSTITTGGSEGAEELEIGDGTGAEIGQRKLIVLEALGDEGDSVTLDDANFSQGSDTITAIELDAEGEFILVEWQGASWEVIKASSGVVAVA